MSHHFLTHRFLRVMTVISFGAALCFAQEKITGTVTDSSGKAIAGALVELEIKKIKTKTGPDGKFDLTKLVGVNSTANVSPNKRLSAHLKDGVLFLNIFKSGPVEITMHTLNGQAVHKVKKIMDKGTHSIPSAHKGIGVYLYRIKTGDNEMILKSYSIGGVSDGSSISGIVTPEKKAFLDSPHKDFRDPPHKDVLVVKANGYVDYDIGVNSFDTSYTIKMLVCADTVTDASGNFYQAVRIGNQIWTTSSLRTTKFNDGTDIPRLQEASKWGFPCDPKLHQSWSKEVMETKAGWCIQHKKDSPQNGGPEYELAITKEWGLLYNWYAAMHSKIAPKGWHVPTRAELFQLRTWLVQNGYNFDGTKYADWNVIANDNKTSAADMAKNKCAKTIASRTYFLENDHRTVGNAGNDIRTNNSSGFNCKPVGSRWCTTDYKSYEASCYLWSSSYSDEEIAVKPQGYHLSFHGKQNYFGANDHDTRTGFQIRILKD